MKHSKRTAGAVPRMGNLTDGNPEPRAAVRR